MEKLIALRKIFLRNCVQSNRDFYSNNSLTYPVRFSKFHKMAAEKLSGGEHTTVTITTTTYSAIDRLAAHPNSSNIENHFHRRRAEKSSTEGHVNGFFRKSDRSRNIFKLRDFYFFKT